MSSFFNKVFGESGQTDKKHESHLPKMREGSIESPFNIAATRPNNELSHQLFGQLADSEATKSSEPVPLHAVDGNYPTHPQGFVRPGKLPVRGFTAGELASLLPPEFINHRSMPAGQEVDLDLTRARQSMASGRPVVLLSDIYAACPRLFARPITSDQDFEVRLPVKRVEALLGMVGNGYPAGGNFSPFQVSPTAHPSASAPTEQFSSSPFEVVGSGASESVDSGQSPVPLFSKPAPAPQEPFAAPVPHPFDQQPEPDRSHNIPLGKALRFAGVDVLGFTASNVPESVFTEISSADFRHRNPNGSATVPLTVLVDGLEPVYRSAFNQADMGAMITIPADVLPDVSTTQEPPRAETSPFSPSPAQQRSTPSPSIESPFAAYAREDAEKHDGNGRSDISGSPSTHQPSGLEVDTHLHREAAEDIHAFKDLSQRLSAFNEQPQRETEPQNHSPERPMTSTQAKPLAPLSGLPNASFPHPQPKFRDLQDVGSGAGGAEDSFLRTPHASATHRDADDNHTPRQEPSPQPQAAAFAAIDDYDDWKQVELKAVFGFEKTLDSKGVFELINHLEDVRCAAFVEGGTTRYSTAGFGQMAPVLSELIGKIRQLSDAIGIHGVQSFALQINRGAVMFFSEGDCAIAVMAQGNDISRASKQRIIMILRELVRG